MDFLSSLIAVAIPFWFTAEEVTIIHSNYCQNLYFQADWVNKMIQYECDMNAVETEVAKVRSGRY